MAGVRFSALEARGWTRDLADLHGDRIARPNRYYDGDVASEIERTPEWQEDAARAARSDPVAFGRADLKRRGWSETMIAQQLGDPDAAGPASGGRVKHLWRAQRVEEAERAAGWANAAATAAARSRTGKATAAARAKDVENAASRAAESLRLDVPNGWSLSTLRRIATEAQFSRDGEEGHDRRYVPDDATVDVWVRNYLRHELSNYDALLDDLEARFTGTPGVNDIYDDVVRPAIDELVEQTIVELS